MLEFSTGICCKLTGAMVCTISLSCLTICFKISFSWLLKTPVLRSFWNFWRRMEFFFPAQTSRRLSQPDILTLYFSSFAEAHMSIAFTQIWFPLSTPELQALVVPSYSETPELSVLLHLQCISIIAIILNM